MKKATKKATTATRKKTVKKPQKATKKPRSKATKKPQKKKMITPQVGDLSNKKDIPIEDLNNLDKLSSKIQKDKNLNEAEEILKEEKQENILNNATPSPVSSDTSDPEIDPSVLDGIFYSCIDIFEASMRYGNRRFLKCDLDPFSFDQKTALKVSSSKMINRLLPEVVLQNPELFGLTLCVVSIWTKNTKPLGIEKPRKATESHTATPEEMQTVVPGAEGVR